MHYQIATPEMRFALGFAKSAGKLIKEKFIQSVPTEWKDNNSPVTALDIELNEQFIQEATKQFPDYSIVGEEASRPLTGAKWTWVIDPIDGTGPFVQGLPLSTCCIALLHDGIPQLGVIYDPVCDRMYYAQKGMGAFMNDQPIRIAAAKTLQNQYVHTDSLRLKSRHLWPLRERLIEKGAIPMLINAIQYGAALTCAGRAAGVVFSLPNCWDAAPVYCIATEAGAVMTDLDGNEQRYDQPTNGFIMANPTIHKQLLQLVQGVLADAEVSQRNG